MRKMLEINDLNLGKGLSKMVAKSEMCMRVAQHDNKDWRTFHTRFALTKARVGNQLAMLIGVTTVCSTGRYSVTMGKGEMFDWSELTPPVVALILAAHNQVGSEHYEKLVDEEEESAGELIDHSARFRVETIKDDYADRRVFHVRYRITAPMFTALAKVTGVENVTRHLLPGLYSVEVFKGKLFDWDADVIPKVAALLLAEYDKKA